MGRAGSGSSGGRASSGGRSPGRSSGGHSVGRSSSGGRAGRGTFGGGSYGGSFSSGSRGARSGPGMPPPGRGPGMPPPPPGGGMRMPPPPPPAGGYRRRSSYHGGGCFGTIIIMVILMAFLIVMFQSCAVNSAYNIGSSYSTNAQKSTIAREKLKTGNAYINNCIVDDLGWFDNVSKTESQLKEFWDETGVQPYIILKEFDPGLTTDSEKEQWAVDYYDENFDTENIFLFVYFAEEDTDNDVGYMAYVNGYETSSVMDSEAVEIFWNNIDKYWYTDLSTDDVFIKAFQDTAGTIMHVSTTGKDILKWALIVLAVALAGAVIINLVKQKNKRAREKAEEDERILKTSIHDIAKDNLEDKYL